MKPSSLSGQITPTKPRKQAGYMLLEATVVLGLIAMATVAYMALQMMQARIDKGKVVGEKYARINASLGQYMSLHRLALKDLPPDCSLHGLASITSKTKLVGTTCKLIINGITVVNGLQPTVQELVNLGLLRTGTTEALDISSKNVIAAPIANGTVGSIAAGTAPAKYSLAPAKLLAVITQRCVPTAHALSGRYVLIRRPLAGDDLALDEVEIISNGSNVANSSVVTSSTPFSDSRTNSLAYYGTSNLVDFRLTTPPPVSNAAYVTPGLFRSEVTASNRAWVQFDLGWQRDIASIGLRSAKGANATGVGTLQAANWQTEGAKPTVEISNTAVNTSTGLIDESATKRTATTTTALVPGTMRYYNNAIFSAAPSTESTPTTQGCPASSWMVLSSLLFNTQPYVLPSWQGSGAMLAMILQYAGSEAAMSKPAGSGELVSAGLSIDNPLRYYDTDPTNNQPRSTGVGGIIAVRNGYDDAQGQTNPDGSTLATEAWDLNGQSLFNVKNFRSDTATVLGNIAAQGAITASTGTFTNLNASTGEFSNVNIADTATAQDVKATRGSFNELKLPVAVSGAACEKTTQSIAQDTAGFFLTCAGTNWSRVTSSNKFDPSTYYKVQIVLNKPTASKPNGTYTPNDWTCSINDSGCVKNGEFANSPVPILRATTLPSDTAFSNTFTWIVPTTLKTGEWLPSVMSSTVTQSVEADLLTSYFNVNENTGSGTWQIGVRAPKASSELILRFYKINP